MTGTALIGAGMIGGTFASALRDLRDIQLVGALARRAGSAAAFLDRHGFPEARAYQSLDEVCADPSVDFVTVITPPNARLEIAKACIAAGKPVLMEKPVERSLLKAREIVELFEAANLPLGIVFQHRSRDSVAALHSKMPELGALQVAEIAAPLWRPQSYYDELGRGSYERDGGGVLITQAIHTMDLALQFTGAVTEVQALCATSGLHNMESEDFVSGGLKFANGAIGSILASTASFPGHPDRINLHFAKGSALLRAADLRINWLDGREEVLGAPATSNSGADPMHFSLNRHRNIITDFAASLRENRPPLATGRSALAVHALIEALERSGREGRRIEVANV